MQAIKDLYKSRHYTQCAKYGERLLAEEHDIQPVHLAYLNFYTALSHDTLAREATLKNRYKSLKLAELYYTAAITALAPADMLDLHGAHSASSSPAVSPMCNQWKRRSSNADSFDSTNSSSNDSAASSTTSYNTSIIGSADHHIPTPKQLANFKFPTPPSSRPQTPQEYHFASSTYSFLLMLQGHLASIQEFKEKSKISANSVRFTFPSPRNSLTLSSNGAAPSTTTATSRTMRSSKLFDLDDEERKEEIRRKRREMTWRKRFDPESVRQLCTEALSELS